MLQEHQRVLLTEDIPEYQLKTGDVGVIVYIHKQGAGYEVEFFTLDGRTYDVITVNANQVRAVGAEILHGRSIA
jgi:hypothetical protein